ncbi:MAG: hypothetical protein Q8P92_02370 [Candidatus Daviesbacteria bacterium]|nr:hypothetical protein [Candidatus Daviesbacteria bacterium]
MKLLLGLLMLSFFMTGAFLVPFIDLLFKLKRKFERHSHLKTSETPIHDNLMKGDVSTPSGGGILLIALLVILSLSYGFFIQEENKLTLFILIFTLLSFGSLGFMDDVKLILTQRQGKFLGLGRRKLFIAQSILALIIGGLLYFLLGLDNLYITGVANLQLGIWYIPLAAFIIVSFANAYNISDGLDGLSSGLLLICLFAFLALAQTTLDTTLASFIGIWIGALLAFLYFNIWPARIFLGDAGAFGFGATLAVVGLLTGKIVALGFIGGVFTIIVASSLLQILSKKLFKKRILPVAPIHIYFRFIGWEEPKIVVRFWLAQSLLAVFGLWIALLSS